jgi:hypothetical protein
MVLIYISYGASLTERALKSAFVNSCLGDFSCGHIHRIRRFG